MRFEVAFIKSCSALGDLPTDNVPEVAILGRSNVGKSSLLNSLAGGKAMARTSRTPGRTRLLNLFDVNAGQLRLVDCPGYGYAKVSQSERAIWGTLIEAYLSERPNLKLAALLVDPMVEAQRFDLDLQEWLRMHHIPTVVVATKWDRLSGNGRPVAARKLEGAFLERPLGFSSVTGEGRMSFALGCWLTTES